MKAQDETPDAPKIRRARFTVRGAFDGAKEGTVTLRQRKTAPGEEPAPVILEFRPLRRRDVVRVDLGTLCEELVWREAKARARKGTR